MIIFNRTTIYFPPINVREATFDKVDLLRNLPTYRQSTQEITDINSNLVVCSVFSINLSFWCIYCFISTKRHHHNAWLVVCSFLAVQMLHNVLDLSHKVSGLFKDAHKQHVFVMVEIWNMWPT